MRLPFEKWHGCKNDFLLFYLNENQFPLLSDSLQRQAPRLCSKEGDGVGADGILILMAGKDHVPSRLLIVNQDGSLARHCGNGIRCAAMSYYRAVMKNQPHSIITGSSEPEGLSLELSPSGTQIFCRFFPNKKRESLPFVQISMGVPIWGEENDWHREGLLFVDTVLVDLQLKQKIREVHSAQLLNKHLLLAVDSLEELSAREWYDLGSRLQVTPAWDGINVTLFSALEIQKKDQEDIRSSCGAELSELYSAQTWERGVGPTQACGSAASVLGSWVICQGFVEKGAWIGVTMPGGKLYVQQKTSQDEVLLCGPAEFVFEGAIDI